VRDQRGSHWCRCWILKQTLEYVEQNRGPNLSLSNLCRMNTWEDIVSPDPYRYLALSLLILFLLYSNRKPQITIFSTSQHNPASKMESLPINKCIDNASSTDAPRSSLEAKNHEIDNTEADLLKVIFISSIVVCLC
jgi:hypothetical protein